MQHSLYEMLCQSANQIPRLLPNKKMYFFVQKIPPLISVLNQMNSFHTLTFLFL